MNGLLVVISSPSGGGKTTVINELIRQLPDSVRLVTSTTRPPRPGEINGVDYHFLTRSEFNYKIVEGDCVEHIQYVEHYYGVDKKLLTTMLEHHPYVFAPIDVRGKNSLAVLPIRQVSIFLEPDSLSMLEENLKRRPGSTTEDIARRLAVAREEITQAATFTYSVINVHGKFDKTVVDVKAILDKIDQTS